MNRSGRTLPQLQAALRDAMQVRNAYVDALDAALVDSNSPQADTPAGVLATGSRVSAALAQLDAAQKHVNALAAEVQLILVAGHE